MHFSKFFAVVYIKNSSHWKLAHEKLIWYFPIYKEFGVVYNYTKHLINLAFKFLFILWNIIMLILPNRLRVSDRSKMIRTYGNKCLVGKQELVQGASIVYAVRFFYFSFYSFDIYSSKTRKWLVDIWSHNDSMFFSIFARQVNEIYNI